MEGTYGNLDLDEPVDQTPTCEHRGSSSSKRRRYGEVIIFLGVLNVLLLAGLIALGVHSRLSNNPDTCDDKMSATFKAELTKMVQNLQVSGGWTCSAVPQQYPAAQIDAGQGMVVMTDRISNAFILRGLSWSKLGSVPLKHVSVGPAGIWGVDQQNKVYKFVASDFVPTGGVALKHVDAGGQDQVVGVASNDNIYCLNADRTSSIKEIKNWITSGVNDLLSYISCAPTGCWGVNSKEEIFVTKISNPCNRPGSWSKTDGQAVTVEVGSGGNVFVVNRYGLLYERIGISDQVPQGRYWQLIEMSVKIKHASYDMGNLQLVTGEGYIMKCTK